jgi:hypothetical protein
MECVEVWCWRGIERLIWTDRVKNVVTTESRRNGISYIQEKEVRLTGVPSALQNTVLKER